MTKVSYVTAQGLEKLMKELEQLETVERPSISEQIAEARDKGDLSEYDAAKEAQGMLELKISKLKDAVANLRIIDQSQLNTDTVQILNKIKIKNKANGAIMEYTIVSDSEANLKENKMSVNTPIAKGLLGKKVGDVAEVEVPSGKMEFEIIEISL
jgi:transcription elongation factor GreA